jgi:hypothetical protein
VPVSIGFNNEVNGYSEQDRLYLFEINGKDNAANASVDRVGSINVDADSWWSNRQRAVFHDDAVFFINADSVWSTLWTDSSQQNGPY